MEFCCDILTVEDIKELCSAVESFDTVTLYDISSFSMYSYDLWGGEQVGQRIYTA